MNKIHRSVKHISAEKIACKADKEQDLSAFFKGNGRMVQPIDRVDQGESKEPEAESAKEKI